MTPRRRTEDVIMDLARRPVPRAFSPLALVLAVMGIMALCVWLFLQGVGVRADLFVAIQKLTVLAKSVLPLLLFVVAMHLALASARPGFRVPVWTLSVPVAAGVILVLIRLITREPAPLVPEILGQTALVCLASITLLAALPLATGLWLMRRGAPTRPGLSGALLGLAAGAGVTVGYAPHCTEDSPLFFVLWYGLAMSLPTAFGTLLGRRVLRW